MGLYKMPFSNWSGGWDLQEAHAIDLDSYGYAFLITLKKIQESKR